MRLDALTKEDCEKVRKWRNRDISGYRTPYLLTKEMQEDFYKDVVCNRNSPHRFWAVKSEEDVTIGMIGLTDIQWENSIAEISIILQPKERGKGTGEQAIDLLLDMAFNQLGLQTVFAECYLNNEIGVTFWQKMAVKYKAKSTELPNRKYWDGVYHNSIYYSFDKNDFNNIRGFEVKSA